MTSKERPLYIIGSRNLALIVREIIDQKGVFSFRGCLDDFEQGGEIVGKCSDASRLADSEGAAFALAVGYGDLIQREALVKRLGLSSNMFPPIISDRAYIGKGAEIGAGSIVMSSAHVDQFVHLGSFNVVWPGAIINHFCETGSHCFFSSGAIIAGNSKVGNRVFFGVGTVGVNNVDIGSDSQISAGVMIYGSIPEHSRLTARPNYFKGDFKK